MSIELSESEVLQCQNEFLQEAGRFLYCNVSESYGFYIGGKSDNREISITTIIICHYGQIFFAKDKHKLCFFLAWFNQYGGIIFCQNICFFLYSYCPPLQNQ